MRRFVLRLTPEAGFTLIETLAALTVLAIVTIGAVPLLVSGLRTSLISKFETQAKNLAQERLELMRNLPFYITSTTSGVPAETCWSDPARTNPRNATTGALECDYRDLLDTYYRSATLLAPSPPSAPAIPSGGYVSTNALRSADEIAAGLSAPYYRFVLNPVPNFENNKFSQVVASQFLDASRQVPTPGSTYNTQSSNTDFPPSRLLGVTIITRWSVGSRERKYVTFSQIAEGADQPTVLTLEAEATAVRIRSALDISNTTQIEAAAALSRSEGTLASGASASTYAQGGYGALVPGGERKDGRYETASAPPSSSAAAGSEGVVALMGGSPPFPVVRFAGTGTGGVTAGIVQEQPSVPTTAPGTGTNFSRGSLLKSGDSYDLQYTNTSDPVSPMPSLDTTRPLVSSKGTGSANTADSRTYLKSTSGTGHFAEAGARTALQETHFLPTTFAPSGIVQVTLNSADVTCKTTGSSTTGTVANFSVTVRYYKADVAGSYETRSYSYNSVTGLSPSTPLPSPAEVVVNPAAVPPTLLSDYIREWSISPGATPSVGAGGSSSSLSLNGIFRLTTKNTRPAGGVPIVADDASAIGATVGLLSCVAEDKRS